MSFSFIETLKDEKLKVKILMNCLNCHDNYKLKIFSFNSNELALTH